MKSKVEEENNIALPKLMNKIHENQFYIEAEQHANDIVGVLGQIDNMFKHIGKMT